MGQLTPFQNQVLDAATAKEAEEKEKRREEMRNDAGSSTPTRNSRTGSGSANNSGMRQEETVRYVNKDLNPDHEIHKSN